MQDCYAFGAILRKYLRIKAALEEELEPAVLSDAIGSKHRGLKRRS